MVYTGAIIKTILRDQKSLKFNLNSVISMMDCLQSSQEALMKHQEQQTQAFPLSRMLPHELQRAPSSSQSTPDIKEELVHLYGLQVGETGAYLRCQATGEVLPSGAVVAGHLFPPGPEFAVSVTISPCVFLIGNLSACWQNWQKRYAYFCRQLGLSGDLPTWPTMFKML